ncbi:hypothetical protein DHD05_08235 [Arenibacter sp. N53]|uniref:hypothetical protein n=1 Tax=Arenibacter TaxID=178469 RepID=UPI000CD4024F|nr:MULTISPECIES: hypothetical protein [Arenibacter]MCM4151574.1 hypothetical protein [Arenibacter sp. N53]
MAPIKFEEHIKEKLDKRKITPSDGAWEELSAQLEHSKPGSQIGFFRIGIAASIIGLLILTLMYLNNSQELDSEGSKTVAAPNTEVKEEPMNNPNVKKVEKREGIVTTNEASELVEIETTKKEKKKVEDITETELTNGVGISNAVAVNDPVEPKGKDKLLMEPNNIITAKIEEIVTLVELMEENNISLTDAEVDSLLKQAQKELFSEKIFRDNHSVDAMALLAEVEGELDQSFRQQIFDMLKEGYFKVKTAVAARNN